MAMNILVAHGGGPTPVINSSLQGVVEAARASGKVDKIYAARFGAEGILKGDLIDLTDVPAETIALLRQTPNSAIGSCRRKLTDADYPTVIETLKKFDIGCFFYNGGNDSMDTCNKINHYMQSVGYECRVMGVPKTIDNDLFGTDHCPGFASAAKYIATSCMEVKHDACCYDTGMVTIIEVMGRHAGWLTAASALANYAGAGPDLIYLPEVDFDMESFLADVERIYKATGKCMVVVSRVSTTRTASSSPRPRPTATTVSATPSSAVSPTSWQMLSAPASPLPRFAPSSRPCCSAAPRTWPPPRMPWKLTRPVRLP